MLAFVDFATNYSYSWDGGSTWSPNVPVSPVFNSLVGFPRQNKIGDYNTIVSGDTGADVAYAATFNNEEDIWYVRVFPDCNANGISDVIDIANTTSVDCNSNHVPDECETAVCGPSLAFSSATPADACSTGGAGNANGAVDPGEDVVLPIALQNDETVSLTSVAAVLSTTTPGVTVTRANATFPDLASHQTATSNAPHFAFRVATTFACGDLINFTLAASTAQGSWMRSFSVRVGAQSVTTSTYSSSDVPKTIADVATVTSSLTVPASGNVLDVDVGLNLTHTYDADLVLVLIAPSGKRSLLAYSQGGAGQNYTGTTFNDEAATGIDTATAPFSGQFKPRQPLSSFDGASVNGTWTLAIQDVNSGDSGTLTSWSLTPTLPAGFVCTACGACTGSTPDGTPCNDGNPCTQTDTCQGGVCTGSTPVVCPADPCHEPGTCDPTTGQCSAATPKTNGTACNDGNACTQTDTCQTGVCTGSNAVTCAAPDACHTGGTCDPTTGACSNPALVPDGTACNDGNACTQTDTCQSGVCTGSHLVVCTAPDSCHTGGTCDPATGTCSSITAAPDGTACDDGNACTRTDTCQAGVCTGSNPVTCSAADACHTGGTCDPGTGTCANPTPLPDGTACSDGNACTSGDSCQSGTCRGTPVTCSAPDSCHGAGTCNPSSGCTYPAKPDGTFCNDGNACTSGDRCHAGNCTGTPRTCTPTDSCHDATCNPSTGSCSYPAKPNGTSCSDGNACTTGDTCQWGTCRGGSAVTCTPPDSYHRATCNTSTGCSYFAKLDGTYCNDDNACTSGDRCQSGTCTGTPKTCTAPDTCHDASCNPSTGSCSYTVKPNGSSCSDGNACTTGDTCQSGSCRSTGVVTCPADACHYAGTCSPSSGQCSRPTKPDGTACDDGNACTSGDVCRAGVCGTTPRCPSGTIDADTTVREAYPSQNFGFRNDLEDGSGSRKWILLRVRVSSTVGITSAKVRLIVKGGSGSSAGSIHPVACSSWTESTATWSNRPQLGSVLDTKGSRSVGQSVDFDVSSVIQGDGTYCFGIDDASRDYTFGSREAFTGRPSVLLQTTCSCTP